MIVQLVTRDSQLIMEPEYRVHRNQPVVTILSQMNLNINLKKNKVKLSHYTPWRHMGGEEV
jgi:hypothetical protein